MSQSSKALTDAIKRINQSNPVPEEPKIEIPEPLKKSSEPIQDIPLSKPTSPCKNHNCNETLPKDSIQYKKLVEVAEAFSEADAKVIIDVLVRKHPEMVIESYRAEHDRMIKILTLYKNMVAEVES